MESERATEHGANPPSHLFYIGKVGLHSRVIPAPMCNISDYAYRALTRRMGADLVTTQMVSAEGLIRGNEATSRLLDLRSDDPPVSVQLVGSNPQSLSRAAAVIVELGATIVDLNMGCPARNVTGNDCGSALMKQPDLVVEIVRAIRRAISAPFTVKMRAGWNTRDANALDLARVCEAEGVDAIALHARTREQGYRGEADWSLIGMLKQAVHVPVIGNGDITSPADAVCMMRETGCDAVMIGRGIIGNPWLVRACDTAIRDYIEGRIKHESEVPGDEMVLQDDGEGHVPIRVPYYMKNVGIDERLALILEHTRLTIDCKGEKRGVMEMRKHSGVYIKGIRGCKHLRERLMKIETYADLELLLAQFRTWLAGGA